MAGICGGNQVKQLSGFAQKAKACLNMITRKAHSETFRCLQKITKPSGTCTKTKHAVAGKRPGIDSA